MRVLELGAAERLVPACATAPEVSERAHSLAVPWDPCNPPLGPFVVSTSVREGGHCAVWHLPGRQLSADPEQMSKVGPVA